MREVGHGNGLVDFPQIADAAISTELRQRKWWTFTSGVHSPGGWHIALD